MNNKKKAMQVGWEETITAKERHLISRAISMVKVRADSRRRRIMFESGVRAVEEKPGMASLGIVPSPGSLVPKDTSAFTAAFERNAGRPSAESTCGTCLRATRGRNPEQSLAEPLEAWLASVPWGREAVFRAITRRYGVPEAPAWWPDGSEYDGLAGDGFARGGRHRPVDRPLGW
jgi:hypothetical protein